MMTFRKFGKGQYGGLDAFSPSMRGTLSSVRGAIMRMGLAGVGRNLATYRHIDSETISGGRRLSRYAVRMGKSGTVYMQVTWTADGHAEQVGSLYGE
jgi:hypothetical protein